MRLSAGVCRVGIAIAILVAQGVAGQSGTAEAPVRYEVTFPNLEHHEAKIVVEFSEIDAGPLEVRMSRSSPGRYALHEFAKNVYEVRAFDRDGSQLPIHRPDPHGWTVTGHGGFVRFEYTLFGDRADGTYAGFDRTHAHFNMPASFAWARGLEARPIEITFTPEQPWKIATQLESTDDPNTYRAPDLAYFLDSPTILGDLRVTEWDVEGQSVRVALLHAGTDVDAERYEEGVRAIVREAAALFGELPDFDYGNYTFLASYLPWVNGDGMEHRNSTMLTSTGSIAQNVGRLWGTVAHEFIHAWNVERIRPADLEPFDFEVTNMSRSLWFAEGFTSYLDDVLLRRAGLIDDGEFARRLGSAINTVTNSPGRGFHSAVEMSMQAPFVDAAVSVDPVNRGNTFISYYTWGSVIGAGLDLSLRARGHSLDELMQEMWTTYGITEIPYAVDDIQAALSRVSGDEAFAEDFFLRFVHGREVPDFEALLVQGGIQLRRQRPQSIYTGLVGMSADRSGRIVVGQTRVGSPFYEAGIDRGDAIIEVDGRAVTRGGDVAGILNGRSPGDQVEVRFESRGEVSTVRVRLAADPALEAVLFEEIRRSPTAAMRSFREAWLSRKGR